VGGTKKTPEWTADDAALWHTVLIARELEARRVPSHRTGTSFALRPGEIAFVGGPFRTDEWRADGDGSYQRSSVFAFGAPTFVAAGLIGNAIGNSRRRADAQWAATPMWRPGVSGWIVVTNVGFHLATDHGNFAWDWGSISQVDVVGRGQLVMVGDSTSGPVRWMIHTGWAELVFVLWAQQRHPDHPQYRSRSWLHPSWPEWAARMGHPLPASDGGAAELPGPG
jgi:hypothetical protein